MVKPGGTGRASTDVISARLAPFPPRRSLSSMGGRACVWSKSKTNGIGPPCPGMANRVRAAVIGWSFQARNEAGRSYSTGPLRPSGAPGRLLLAGCRPGDLALEDLLGLAHEVPHDRQLLRLEPLGDLLHLLDDGLLRVLEPFLGRRYQLDPDAAAIVGI